MDLVEQRREPAIDPLGHLGLARRPPLHLTLELIELDLADLAARRQAAQHRVAARGRRRAGHDRARLDAQQRGPAPHRHPVGRLDDEHIQRAVVDEPAAACVGGHELATLEHQVERVDVGDIGAHAALIRSA